MPRASGPIAANTPMPSAACNWAFRATPFLRPAISASAVVIMPSQRMVVVRMGDAVDPTGDMSGLARLIREVIEATSH